MNISLIIRTSGLLLAMFPGLVWCQETRMARIRTATINRYTERLLESNKFLTSSSAQDRNRALPDLLAVAREPNLGIIRAAISNYIERRGAISGVDLGLRALEPLIFDPDANTKNKKYDDQSWAPLEIADGKLQFQRQIHFFGYWDFLPIFDYQRDLSVPRRDLTGIRV